MLSDNFYRAFEDRHRGSRDLVKSRLNTYLPFVQPLRDVDPAAQAVDLGCGRGEWLELLWALGLDATGVDLDPGMLEACRELGLKAEHGDALAFITALPDESQWLVSAFHVVEHISFQALYALVTQAFRVLRPGGLLILETPNPENILVATRDFYLDPTHQRPIPPVLLAFLPEHCGFARTKILRLQEHKELSDSVCLTLQDVLEGPSPDYSVVAQKAGPETVMSYLDELFLREYGLSLETLTQRYHKQLSARFELAEAKAEQAESRSQDALAKAERAVASSHDALTKAERTEARSQEAEAKARQAELVANDLSARLSRVYTSTSWRVTLPLRVAKQVLVRLVTKVKKALYPAVSASLGYVLAHPRVRAQVSVIVNKFPWLHRRLLRVAISAGMVSSYRHRKSPAGAHMLPDSAPDQNTLMLGLTPEAQRIYRALQERMNRQFKGDF